MQTNHPVQQKADTSGGPAANAETPRPAPGVAAGDAADTSDTGSESDDQHDGQTILLPDYQGARSDFRWLVRACEHYRSYDIYEAGYREAGVTVRIHTELVSVTPDFEIQIQVGDQYAVLNDAQFDVLLFRFAAEHFSNDLIVHIPPEPAIPILSYHERYEIAPGSAAAAPSAGTVTPNKTTNP